MKKSGELNSIENLRTYSSYIVGVIALVLAIFSPIPGIVLGIVGLVQSQKQKNEISKKAKVLNIIAIGLGIVIAVISVWISLSGVEWLNNSGY